jgi:hypothetical protein
MQPAVQQQPYPNVAKFGNVAMLEEGCCSDTMTSTRGCISGPDLATGARLLSFSRTQPKVVIGLLTGHNTLRRHLYVMGLGDNLRL